MENSSTTLQKYQGVPKSRFKTSIRANSNSSYVQVKGVDKHNKILGATEIMIL